MRWLGLQLVCHEAQAKDLVGLMGHVAHGGQGKVHPYASCGQCTLRTL